MPEGFDFPEEHDIWLPLAHTPGLEQRGAGSHMAFGRLRDDANLEEARTELATINRRLEAAWPATNRGVVPTLKTYSQFFVGPDAPMIYGSLWAAAWFVFLIACANLANLTLARTMGRWRDFATRIALGAGQGRMLRQIFVESLMLASVAAALGWWITKWGVRAWAVETASRYQILDYRVDSGTLGYLVGISLAAAILFSLAPIGRVLQLGVNGALKGDARGVTPGLRGKHLAAVLVVGQMALAIVLLAGAGVLVRSLVNVVSAKTGVRDPENILVGAMRLPSDKYPTPQPGSGISTGWKRTERPSRELRMSRCPALFPWIIQVCGCLRSRDGRQHEHGESAQFLSAGPDYFRVVGASTVSGRGFNDGIAWRHCRLPL